MLYSVVRTTNQLEDSFVNSTCRVAFQMQCTQNHVIQHRYVCQVCSVRRMHLSVYPLTREKIQTRTRKRQRLHDKARPHMQNPDTYCILFQVHHLIWWPGRGNKAKIRTGSPSFPTYTRLAIGRVGDRGVFFGLCAVRDSFALNYVLKSTLGVWPRRPLRSTPKTMDSFRRTDSWPCAPPALAHGCQVVTLSTTTECCYQYNKYTSTTHQFSRESLPCFMIVLIFWARVMPCHRLLSAVCSELDGA